MRVGIVFSISLLVLLVVIAMMIAAMVLFIPGLSAMSDTTRFLVGSSIVAAVFAAIMIPMGIALDRSISQVQRYIEGAAVDESGETGDYAGPRWLMPITYAFMGAVDQFHQREQELRGEIRDLEIRHRVSEAERRQVEAVLHALHDAVIVTDSFNEIVMVNQAAAETLGFDRETVIHQPINQVVSDERLCRLIDDARQTANFSDCRHIEHEVTGDGSGEQRKPGILYDVTLSCVANHKNEVAGVVTILRDLTREREISQMKSDFVSKASHELRTPLSSIRAYVEMLVDGEAEDEQSRQEFYRIIQDETDRLGRLIDNMLNISRIEAGIVQIEREQVDMKELIERAINTLEPHAREKDITFHAKTTNVDLCVEGDPDMLYQVVLNLASNAVKYTPEGGRITIAGDTDNLTGSVLVSVSDTGLGIPPDSVPKLFEKFYRVENYKRVAKGTGLGLSLCKHIVETVHHGQISVESKLGMGSKFWFTVPMQYAGSKKAA